MREFLRTQYRKAGRARRTRSRLRGTALRPRLSVFRSNLAITAQLIDDVHGVTIAAASDRELTRRRQKSAKRSSRRDRAVWVGATIAKRAGEHGITAAVFDRGPYRFHGLVAALAEGARAEGLTL